MSSKSLIVCGVVLILGLVGFLSWPRRYPTSLPTHVLSLINRAETIHVFSLDPYTRDNMEDRSLFNEHENSATKFHGYTIYGSQKYTEESSKKHFRQAIIDSTPSIRIDPAACFWPRHGVRFTAGSETLDLVICFQCHSMNIYSPSGDDSHLVTSGGKAVLNRMLKAEGIKVEPEQY